MITTMGWSAYSWDDETIEFLKNKDIVENRPVIYICRCGTKFPDSTEIHKCSTCGRMSCSECCPEKSYDFGDGCMVYYFCLDEDECKKIKNN